MFFWEVFFGSVFFGVFCVIFSFFLEERRERGVFLEGC